MLYFIAKVRVDFPCYFILFVVHVLRMTRINNDDGIILMHREDTVACGSGCSVELVCAGVRCAVLCYVNGERRVRVGAGGQLFGDSETSLQVFQAGIERKLGVELYAL